MPDPSPSAFLNFEVPEGSLFAAHLSYCLSCTQRTLTSRDGENETVMNKPIKSFCLCPAWPKIGTNIILIVRLTLKRLVMYVPSGLRVPRFKSGKSGPCPIVWWTALPSLTISEGELSQPNARPFECEVYRHCWIVWVKNIQETPTWQTVKLHFSRIFSPIFNPQKFGYTERCLPHRERRMRRPMSSALGATMSSIIGSWLLYVDATRKFEEDLAHTTPTMPVATVGVKRMYSPRGFCLSSTRYLWVYPLVPLIRRPTTAR